MATYIRANHLQIKEIQSSSLDFEIEKGEIIAITGPNGAGKSSLLRYLAALERPDQMGRLMIGGLDPFHSVTHSKIHRMTGYLPQNPEEILLLDNTLKDIIFGPENLGVEADTIKKRTIGLMKKFGMYQQRGKAYETLSEGQRQKAALLSVLSMRQEILLLDDPVWTEDLGVGYEILKWTIQTAKKLNQTVIFTSQNKKELSLADRILYLYDGSFHKEPWEPQEVKGEVKIGTEIAGDFFVPDYVSALENGLTVKEYVVPKDKERADRENEEKEMIEEKKEEEKNLRAFSFYFHPGSLYQIVSSGASKNGLGEVLMGIRKEKGANVEKNGTIAMSAQNPNNVIFEETVLLQVKFLLKGKKQEKDLKAKGILRELHLYEGIDDKNPKKLSMGAKKLVDIASILAAEPDIAVFDMPFSVLDYENREIVLNLLRKYAAEHVVIVTGEIADE